MASSEPRMFFIIFLKCGKLEPSYSYKLYSYKSVQLVIRAESVTFSLRVQVANYEATEIN